MSEDLALRLDALRARGAARLAPLRWVQLEALARRLAGLPEAVRGVVAGKVEAACAELEAAVEAAHAAGASPTQSAPAVMSTKAPPSVVPTQTRPSSVIPAKASPSSVVPAKAGTQGSLGSPREALGSRLRGNDELHRLGGNDEFHRLRGKEELPRARGKDGPLRPREKARPHWPQVTTDHDLPSVLRFRQAWAQSHAQDRVQRAWSQRPTQAGPLNSHALVLESLQLLQGLPPAYLRRFVSHAETLLWLEDAVPEKPRATTSPKKRHARR